MSNRLLMHKRPFQLRSPDFRRVRYEFTYSSPAAAQAAHDALRDKRYVLLENGDYVLPVGHRLCCREEAVDGARLTFVGQVKAASLPSSPELQDMELEIAGADGSMTGKVIEQQQQ